MVARKPDSEDIKKHIRKLKEQPWLGPAQAWWPDCLFRFEPVETAVRILEDGRFLSRSAAARDGQLTFDSASPSVISSTDEHWKEYVRLYFRPRSPTQYSTEGFRIVGSYPYGALCPMPIVFVLDATDILTRAGTIFSNGNLAASATTGDTALFLGTIPFQYVYHEGAFDQAHRSTIIFHRHAEVIIPEALDLTPVRFIGCRTQAEYETLLFNLSPEAREKWTPKIGLGTRANLHFRNWIFVEQVSLSQNHIVFQFNPSCRGQSPFKIKFELAYPSSGKSFFWEKNDYKFDDSTLKFNLEKTGIIGGYNVRLTIDGRVAYANNYTELSVPF
jgi:hypothetical protein